jgi:hypothetical protein
MKVSLKALLATMFSFGVLFSLNASAGVTNVNVHVHNPCRSAGKQCFQLDIYLDGNLAKTCVTSPGDPNAGTKSFRGTNTPEFNPGRFTSINGAGYVSHRGDPMPYAMHIDGTGFAVHGSALRVDGTKASHGCMRLKTPCAKELNHWMRESRDAGGSRQIIVEDTKARY